MSLIGPIETLYVIGPYNSYHWYSVWDWPILLRHCIWLAHIIETLSVVGPYHWDVVCDWPISLRCCLGLAHIIETLFVIGPYNWEAVCYWPTSLRNFLWLGHIIETLYLIGPHNWNAVCGWPTSLRCCLWLAHYNCDWITSVWTSNCVCTIIMSSTLNSYNITMLYTVAEHVIRT